MENTLEKMSIDTESKQAAKQYTSELQQPTQQPIQHTMLIASPMTAPATTTTTNINTASTTDPKFSVDTSTQQQQQQPYSSTMNPFVFLDHDISLLQALDLFPKESSLNQVLTQHSAAISSTSSTTSTSASSPTMNHPPTSLLKDSLLDDMLTHSLSLPTNPFFHLENSDYSTNTTTSNAIQDGSSTTNASRTATPISAKCMTRKKPSPPGQTTMPIRICAKSTRPRRHIECYNCKATKSPLWRRTPDRKETLCNACGLYYRQYSTHRATQSRHKSPLGHMHNNTEFAIKVSGLSNASSSSTDSLSATNRHKKDDTDDVAAAAAAGDGGGGGTSRGDQEHSVQCTNCLQTRTPLWRKNERGEPVCNACGLYSRLHHRDRPVKMRKKAIQRRRRDYWNNDEGKDQQQHQLQETCLGNSTMVSTFSLSQPTVHSEMQHHHQEPLLSPTTSMASSPDSTTMDDITLTAIPTTFSTAPITIESNSTPLPVSDKSALDFGEDSRFASLLVQMDRHQMQGFLGMLEQRCNVVRTLLHLSENGSG